jgi:hypothetical protein
MHILIRKISPYSGADILLGVFTDAASAEFTRSLYWNLRAGDAVGDAWHRQGFRPDGLQDEDLITSQIVGPAFNDGETAYVLSLYEEGMGQLLREFISLHKDFVSAKAAQEKLEAAITSDFPSYYIIQEVKVGELLSDAKEDQPRL